MIHSVLKKGLRGKITHIAKSWLNATPRPKKLYSAAEVRCYLDSASEYAIRHEQQMLKKLLDEIDMIQQGQLQYTPFPEKLAVSTILGKQKLNDSSKW